MDSELIQHPMLIIYNLAKLGLIHPKRKCRFCNQQMRFGSYMSGVERDKLDYLWRCPLCCCTQSVLSHSIMLYHSFAGLD